MNHANKTDLSGRICCCCCFRETEMTIFIDEEIARLDPLFSLIKQYALLLMNEISMIKMNLYLWLLSPNNRQEKHLFDNAENLSLEEGIESENN